MLEPRQSLTREPRVKASIALRLDQFKAIRERAVEERHGNVSLIVQRAVDRELDAIRAAEEQEPQLATA